MPLDSPPILTALGELFRASKAGREGSTMDFLCDFHKLLVRAKSTDGDARERATEDLQRAVIASGECLTLDYHPKDPSIVQRVRLHHSGGEAWLFQQLSKPSPSTERSALAACLLKQIEHPPDAPWTTAWSDWLSRSADHASAGKSVQPFDRTNLRHNELLCHAIRSVLNWRDESLVRYASMVIFGESKALENFRPKIAHALRDITSDPTADLETFRILETPRSVLIHGPLVLRHDSGDMEFGFLKGPIVLSAIDLESLEIRTSASLCLTVENEGVFRELAKCRTGALLIHTSFPGAATRLLLGRLPPHLPIHHFGDSDPPGFDILRDLRAKSGRPIKPMCMHFRPSLKSDPLTSIETSTLQRLLTSPTLTDVHSELEAMLAADTKGDFEQEAIPLADIQRFILTLIASRRRPTP